MPDPFPSMKGKLRCWKGGQWVALAILLIHSSCGRKTAPRPLTAEESGAPQVENVRIYREGANLAIEWEQRAATGENESGGILIQRRDLSKGKAYGKPVFEEWAAIREERIESVWQEKTELAIDGTTRKVVFYSYPPDEETTFLFQVSSPAGIASAGLLLRAVRPAFSDPPSLEIAVVTKEDGKRWIQGKILNPDRSFPAWRPNPPLLIVKDSAGKELSRSEAETGAFFWAETEREVLEAHFEDRWGNRSATLTMPVKDGVFRLP